MGPHLIFSKRTAAVQAAVAARPAVVLTDEEVKAQRRYLLYIEYNGSKYYGSQRQPEIPTVQAAIEEALLAVMKEVRP